MLGPLHALGLHASAGRRPSRNAGYGPLVAKGPELALPPEFNYQVISRQGEIMYDGLPTPGCFDGMGTFRGKHDTTILIRNHENRERPGEVPVVVPKPYDPSVRGGNTKLEVSRQRTGFHRDGQPRYRYAVENSFTILGGTSTNCAGGVMPFETWITCEEVVKGPTFGPPPPAGGGPTLRKHGYIFGVDALADRPLPAVPIVAAGRFAHEAAVWHSGILYETEDRRNNATELGSCFYRFRPDHRLRRRRGHSGANGVLEALKLRREFRANMDVGRPVGMPYRVEWVTIDEPDHDDDTDMNTVRIPGMTPVRFQAQDKGAAVFDRQEGMWVAGDGKIYFDCTEGGASNFGQVWEYDPDRERLTLIYESTDPVFLKHPDNIVIVPQTGHMLLCEDSSILPQYIRGLTVDGEIYDFAQALVNQTEFAGACFDPDGRTLYVNQYGMRSERDVPGGPSGQGGVTYAIYGPFGRKHHGRDHDDDHDHD
jgi:secreted PhoX family phosphatase